MYREADVRKECEVNLSYFQYLAFYWLYRNQPWTKPYKKPYKYSLGYV